MKKETMQILIDELRKDADLWQSRYDALVEAENKPEYPDGTPGYFGDYKIFGFLETADHEAPYCRHLTPDLDTYQGSFIRFTPLPEAILPHPVENTGTCPWNAGDEVRVEFVNGTFKTDTEPTEWDWDLLSTHYIVRSWLIKAAEK